MTGTQYKKCPSRDAILCVGHVSNIVYIRVTYLTIKAIVCCIEMDYLSAKTVRRCKHKLSRQPRTRKSPGTFTHNSTPTPFNIMFNPTILTMSLITHGLYKPCVSVVWTLNVVVCILTILFT